MDLRALQTDLNKQENGVWQSIGEDGAALLLAKLPNAKFTARMDALQKPYRALMRSGGRIPSDRAREITAKAIAETVLLGWRGLTQDGDEIAYSQEKAYELLSDPRYSALADLTVEMARDHATFSPDDVEADAKN